MALFRKQSQTAVPPTTAPVPAEREPGPSSAPTAQQPLFDGPRVDIPAVYRAAKISTEELDRVVRAGELLQLLPSKASKTREVVDATFRAFSVDRSKIIDAASKQLDSLESFIRYSHTQTERVLDANGQRIAELEAEIERCRQASALATQQSEERARTINDELQRVQRVLEFFGDELDADSIDIDDVVGKHGADKAAAKTQSAAKPS